MEKVLSGKGNKPIIGGPNTLNRPYLEKVLFGKGNKPTIIIKKTNT
jgi:hypothetical protein